MKTLWITGCRAGRFAIVGCALVALLGAAVDSAAQTTVTTLGGGPKTLPVSLANSPGNADGLTFNIAQFNNPAGVAVDALGNLFLADTANSALRIVARVGQSTSFTSTIVTGLNQPIAVLVDSNNFVYVLTQGDGGIRKYDSAGSLQSTITTALAMPVAFTFDTGSNFIVTELGGALRRVTNAIGGGVSNLFNFGAANRGVAVLATNSIAVATSSAIVNFNPVTGTTNLIAGAATPGFVDGLAADARFNNLHQMVKAPDGSLLVCDRANHRVRVVSPEGTVSTLYGVATNRWVDSPNSNPVLLAGWVDGTTNAAAREPVGIALNAAGTIVYVTEDAYHLLRQVTGVNFVPRTSTGGGGGGGTVNNNTNLVANLITFGFQSGEGSSEFIGSPGQKFFAPVTLTLLPGQNMYSLGFTLAVTNVAITNAMVTNNSPPIPSGSFGFASMLKKPNPDFTGFFLTIPPQFLFTRITNVFFTNGAFVTNITPVFTNAVFTNASQNLLNVNWLETQGQTNLYDTTSQDLITFSQAHISLFNKAGGSVILGAYNFLIPTNAVVSNAYRIQVFNATASTNVSGGVNIAAPTNGSLTIGPINSIKEVTVAIRPYLVGDVSNFRWLNAGDFGDGTLTLDDAAQTFQSAIYRLNVPPIGSDFFNAMDSSNGSTNGMYTATSTAGIDAITMGDGQINVDDVFVTLRRAGDPYSTWYVRYWSNGVLNASVTSNTLPRPTFGFDYPAGNFARSATSPPAGVPFVHFRAGDAVGRNQSLSVPIYADVEGNLPIRVMMLRLGVQPLDGAPPLTQPVQFQFLRAGVLGPPAFSGAPTTSSYFALWLNDAVPGLAAGTNLIGNLVITLPINTPNDAAYAVVFDHASASPNGLALFTQRLDAGLVTATDRTTASSWADGIPDAWRLRYFGTLFNQLSAASADATGDGVSNYHKFRTGADPNDPSTTLRLLTTVATNAQGQANSVKLRWPTRSNKTYLMEYAAALHSTNWFPVTTNVFGNGRDIEFTNFNVGTGLNFYRVRLVEP